MKTNFLDWLAFVLVVIGGLNWGLIGIIDFNLVTAIFGETNEITNIIYIVFGAAALYLIVTAGKMRKTI